MLLSWILVNLTFYDFMADKRLNLIKDWLKNDLKLTLHSIAPASADASFRRYFRISTDQGISIVMDAPPEKESIIEFISIDQKLRAAGVHAPRIKAQSIEYGLLLLEDLGNRTYLDELHDNANLLYGDAIKALIKIQLGTCESSVTNIPSYSSEKLCDEMALFKDWYLSKHLNIEINSSMNAAWSECQQFLIQTCLEQPQVLVHRDFHCRNLMITEEESPGVIDFQDMVVGPIAYDLASIFKDCYIEWPRHQQIEWLEHYRQHANQALKIDTIDSIQLLRWYDLTALQRHLKVLGIFCRLYYRDGKKQYLKDLPLVAKYTLETLDIYPELRNFKQHFANLIQRAL